LNADPCISILPRNLVYTCEHCAGRLDATNYLVDAFKCYDGTIEHILCFDCMREFTLDMHRRRRGES